jgi:hypothetical protein
MGGLRVHIWHFLRTNIALRGITQEGEGSSLGYRRWLVHPGQTCSWDWGLNSWKIPAWSGLLIRLRFFSFPHSWVSFKGWMNTIDNHNITYSTQALNPSTVERWKKSSHPYTPTHPKLKRKKFKAPWVHVEPSHWLHKISISKTDRHHSWPGLIPPLEAGGTFKGGRFCLHPCGLFPFRLLPFSLCHLYKKKLCRFLIILRIGLMLPNCKHMFPQTMHTCPHVPSCRVHKLPCSSLPFQTLFFCFLWVSWLKVMMSAVFFFLLQFSDVGVASLRDLVIKDLALINWWHIRNKTLQTYKELTENCIKT